MSYGFYLMSAAGQVATLWTPANMVVAPRIWMDHTTPVTNVSGNASAWNNVGTEGGSFAQSTSSRRPGILAAELNGKRVLRFNEDYLQSNALDVFRDVTSATVFAVFKKRGNDVSAADRPVVLFGNNAAATRVGLFAGRLAANRMDGGGRRLDGNSYNYVQSATARSGAWVMADVTNDYIARTITLSVNGTVDAAASGAFDGPGSTSNTAGAVNTIGSVLPSGGIPSTYADVDIAAIIASPGVPFSDRQRIEGYYAHEYALQSNLPADHPFRHTPPYVNTPVLQPSFSTDPVVFGFVAATDSGDVGVAAGDAVASEFGTLLNSEPALGTGEGIEVLSDGSAIAVTLTGLTPTATLAQAVVMDHKGQTIVTIALSGSGPYTGTGVGELVDGDVYYVRIEA